MLEVYLDSEGACKQLEAMRTGTVPTTVRETTGSNNATYVGKMGCFHDTGYGFSAATPYTAYYTPYGLPIP